VHEVHKPITEKHGFFIEGKFDQFQRNIPFFAFTQAFGEMVHMLLIESEEKLAQWKNKILEAVGSLGKVITDLLPALELIIGKQPDIPQTGAAETQNRLLYVFRNFINVFCGQEHPFVLFIDDLQWADSGSLLLLSNLLNNNEKGYFLLIGAYRNNEVDPSHPLITTLENIKKTGIHNASIELNNLEEKHVLDLLKDTLQSSGDRVSYLSRLIYKKTQGNPFFISQFIKTLYEEGTLHFNFQKLEWEWDDKAVQLLNSTDNVVDLLASRTQKLPAETQEVLKFAACVGNRFDLTTLSILLNQSPLEVNKQLYPALMEGLIMPRDSSFMIMDITEDMLLKLEEHYYFVHDRVQQAVYSLIEPKHRRQLHLTVGKLLLRHVGKDQLDEKIFDIIYHLNQGLELVTDEQEKINYAQLNARAGLKAKKSSAFKPAFDFYNTAIQLVGDKWQQQYKLLLELYTEGAEAAYLKGDKDTMNLWLKEVFHHAVKVLDVVKAYNIKIDAETSINELPAALQTGMEVLEKLGVHFPKHPKTPDIFLSLISTQIKFINKKIESLAQLPAMTDEYKLQAMPILHRLIPAAFMSGSKLFPMIVFKMVKLSMQYGNTEASAMGYASFAITHAGILGNIDIGSRLGKIAMEVFNKFYSEEYKVKVLFTVNNFIVHWKEHLRVTAEPLLESFHLGLKVGDLVGGTWAAYYRLLNQFFYGKELINLEKEMVTYCNVFDQYKQEAALNRTNMLRQVVYNLMGNNTDPLLLNGTHFQEAIIEQIQRAGNDQTSVFCFYYDKAFLAYLMGSYKEANDYAEQAVKYINAVTGLPEMTTFIFYDTLIALAYHNEANEEQQKKLLARASRNLKKLGKWAKSGPQNYQHKQLLAEAEHLRITKNYGLAGSFYDKASNAAPARTNIFLKKLLYMRGRETSTLSKATIALQNIT
jgi:predicted ATPase